ncbi:MAG: hypothetical protein ACC726_04325 [Chloroflexota bacterium]
MQRNMWRAMLLAITILLLGALPVVAQSTNEGTVFNADDGRILLGVRNDVTLAAGQEADVVVIIEGSALIEGSAKGLVMINADVTIQGLGASVDGIFAVGGSLTIGTGASVTDVAFVETTIVGAENISGEFNDVQQDLAGAVAWIAAAMLILLFFMWIGIGLALLFSALLAVAFGTSQLRRAAFNIGNDVLKTVAVGLLALIVPWIVIGLLAITIVGLPIAIGLAIVWSFLVFLGYIVVGLWIGERILRRSRMAARPYGAAFLGVLILMLLSWVPLVTPLAILFGTGSVTLAGWRVLRGRGLPPPPPPGYGAPYGQPQQLPPPPYAPPPYAPPATPYPPQGQYPPQQGGPPPASWPQG